jgi:hypothetical protein
MTTHGDTAGPPIVVTSVVSERLSVPGDDPAAHAALVPTGLCHAAPLGQQHTLCGLVTEPLSWFPGLRFAAADFLRRCDACLTAVRAA